MLQCGKIEGKSLQNTSDIFSNIKNDPNIFSQFRNVRNRPWETGVSKL